MYGFTVLSAEVYEVCADNGVDDPPAGNYLALSGDPVACALQGQASDHRPVLVEIELP